MELLIFLGIILLIILFVFIFHKRKELCTSFLLKNSTALIKLNNINKKYKFIKIMSDYDTHHAYDNIDYYDMISCDDYLIYYLDQNKTDITNLLKLIKTNKQMYANYCKEISSINEFGNYKNSNNNFSLKYMLGIEKELFEMQKLKPTIDYYITITLYCAKMNSEIYSKKQKIFSYNEIESLLKRINNKHYNFYNDKQIWDSLCKVERGKVSNKIRFQIYERDDYRCCKCKRSDNLEIDHIIPISKGGKSTLDNLQTLCRECNKNKGNYY